MDWIILVFLSAIFIAFHNIISKKILYTEKKEILLLYMNLIIVILTFVLFFNQINFSLEPKYLFVMLIKSINITFTWLALYSVYKNWDISFVAPLRNISPILLIILSFLFLGEKLTLIQLFGSFIIVIGALLMDYDYKNPKNSLAFFKSKSFLYLLYAFVGNSISAIIDKTFTPQIGVYSAIFYFYLFNSLIFIFINLKNKNDLIPSFKNNYKLFFLTSIFFFFAEIFYQKAVAMPGTYISLIIIIRRFGNVLTSFLGGRILHEKNYFYRTGISIFMLFGIYLIL